jgi:hypothetical protein
MIKREDGIHGINRYSFPSVIGEGWIIATEGLLSDPVER